MIDLDEKVKGGPSGTIFKLLAWAALIVIAIVGVVLVAGQFRNADLASQTRDLTRDLTRVVRLAQQSSDCRTEYNSDRRAVIDHVTALALQSNIDFAGFLLGDPTSSVGKLMGDKAALEAANQMVIDLPPLEEMVNEGYQFDGGDSHPPCPRVGAPFDPEQGS